MAEVGIGKVVGITDLVGEEKNVDRYKGTDKYTETDNRQAGSTKKFQSKVSGAPNKQDFAVSGG